MMSVPLNYGSIHIPDEEKHIMAPYDHGTRPRLVHVIPDPDRRTSPPSFTASLSFVFFVYLCVCVRVFVCVHMQFALVYVCQCS